MKTANRIRVFVVVLALGMTGSRICAAQADASESSPANVSTEIQELRKELADLRNQVALLKSGAASTSPAMPASAAVPAAGSATPTPAKPDPLAGLSSVLGGATVVGLVDGYYGYNFNNPAGGATALSGAPGNYTSLRLFDPRNNQFALNLVELGLVKTPDADNRLGYKAIFGFGDAMQQINVVSGGDPTWMQYLKEAYLSYLVPVGKGLQVDVGKWVTPNGAEVIESNANWNYSRSLLFNYAIPFYHYGVRAQYTFNPKFSLTGYLANGWNDVVHDTSTGYNNSGKTGGLTFAWNATKKLTLTENWMGGPGATQLDAGHWRNLFDTVVAYNWNSKLSFQLNGDYGRVERTTLTPGTSVNWWGGAGYIRYQFDPKYAIATRYEYYNDPDGYTTGLVDAFGRGPHIQEVTASFERRIATHLISRLEYRHDESNQAFFPKGRSSNPLVNGQNTMAIGMMFVLEPNEANK